MAEPLSPWLSTRPVTMAEHLACITPSNQSYAATNHALTCRGCTYCRTNCPTHGVPLPPTAPPPPPATHLNRVYVLYDYGIYIPV